MYTSTNIHFSRSLNRRYAVCSHKLGQLGTRGAQKVPDRDTQLARNMGINRISRPDQQWQTAALSCSSSTNHTRAAALVINRIIASSTRHGIYKLYYIYCVVHHNTYAALYGILYAEIIPIPGFGCWVRLAWNY